MNFVFSINWNCNAKYFLVFSFFELNEKKNFVILIIVSKEKEKMNYRIRWHIYFLKCNKIISSVERFHSATSKREMLIFNLYLEISIYVMVLQFAMNIQMHPNCIATNIWSQTITPYAKMCIFIHTRITKLF